MQDCRCPRVRGAGGFPRRLLGLRVVSMSLIVGAPAVLGSCGTAGAERMPFEECAPAGCGGGGAFVVERVIPTDERPATTQHRRPPPISGGTLLASRDGKLAVVADPERDRIVLVDLTTQSVATTLQLDSGAEPGRVIEDDKGQFHVVLRGAGSVLTLDRQTGSISATRKVCAEPRGLAMDVAARSLLVACAEGSLVELELSGTKPIRTVELGPDLRDVVVIDRRVYVSRFRSAELLELTPDRTVNATRKAPSSFVPMFQGGAVRHGTVEPAVAWRSIASGDSVVVLHQRATASAIVIAPEGDPPGALEGTSAYGGGVGTCGGIVQTGVATVSPEGVVRTSAAIPSVLAVDVAVSPSSELFAVAHAGMRDPSAPSQTTSLRLPGPSHGSTRASTPAPFGGVSAGVLVVGKADLDAGPSGCAPALHVGDQPAVAVAFVSETQLLAQTREPSQLLVADLQSGQVTHVRLSGDVTTSDTGHDLFHRDAGAGIACASCHPEGGEDGRVWNFSTTGPRRTQALHVGLEGTAPFHWEGDLPDVASLMSEVFVRRMGGAYQSSSRLDSLTSYMFSLKAPAPARSATDASALRGKALFDSAETGCATCHSGPKLTNNETVDIGKGVALQVPSLVGLSRRAPYMHDGCAPTLAERFTPHCGGTKHGDTSSLDPAELLDLSAYLETL